jgi:acetyl-CoA acyltransferase
VNDAYVIDAVRTPIGRYGGALANARPDDLAAHVVRAAVERNDLPEDAIEEVLMGCANQAGEDNRNVARMASLLAGLPVEVPGVTVNRLCASGLEAVSQGARQIMLGDGDLVLAGGVESMTRAPLAMAKPDRSFPRGEGTLYDTTIGWRFVNPRMAELYSTEGMGATAENVAERYGIGRPDQDEFALQSHRRAVAAAEAGRFDEEIVPVPSPQPKGDPVTVHADEQPRPDTSLEKLARLRPAFREGGTVTAGNSSPMNDGASAVLLSASEDGAIARVASRASSAVEPQLYGIGPVEAANKALARAGIGWGDLKAVELNEAFAAQSLACLAEWTELDPEILNVNGGAIALGHALGNSGTRLLTTLAHELKRRGGGWGLATMCIGVGQGVAMVIEA